MTLNKEDLINSLKKQLPSNLVEELINEFIHIKQQYFLRKWRATELNSARFSECVLRILEFLDGKSVTPLETAIKSSEGVINSISNNISLDESVRLVIPRLVRVVLDFRNKRDVAHVGGEVNPNQSDSLLVIHSCNWILTELVRKYHSVSIDMASQIVKEINEISIPIINEFDGFVRVLDNKLDASQKTLCILYYKSPEKIQDKKLFEWVGYSNLPNFKSRILKKLHDDNLLHYMHGFCELTSKGILFAEKNISFNVTVV